MKIEEKVKLCKGCESLYTFLEYTDGGGRDIINCNMIPVYKDTECPCLKCLVKMRCIIDDSDCEEFIAYRHNLPLRLM